MKKTRLLLIGVLASLSLAIQAQNYLPQKNSFSLGGGMMWGIGNTKGGFLDKTGNPTCAEFIMDYRHYWGGDLAVGATYNFLTGNKNGNSLRCNYIAPTLTYRWLWAENKQGFWATLGIGYLHTITTYTKSDAPADRCDLLIEWGDGSSSTLYRSNGTADRGCPYGGEPIYNLIKKNIYRGTHTYSTPGMYRLSMMDYNRNEGVKNIANSVGVPFYIE